MKVNIKQISDATGFSAATISNALTGHRAVSKEATEKILEVAKRLGYVAEKKIDKIKLVICKKTGNVVADTPFFGELIEGMEKTGKEFGYDTLVSNINIADTDEIEKLKRDTSTGLILLATELTEEDMKFFDDCEAPIVVIDSWYDNMKYDSVLISNTDSSCQAVGYLFDKGHKNIGYLKGKERITNFHYREIGWIRAYMKKNIFPGEGFSVELGTTMETAKADMDAYLDELEKEGKSLPVTAYFADNDIIALGAIRSLKDHGYKIPADVSVVGFDDMPFCEVSSPPLTTIRVFKQEMGIVAVKRLLEHLADDKVINNKIQVCTKFVERGSVSSLID